MSVGKIVCYIHNVFSCGIINKTLGIDTCESNCVSLSDFLFGILYSIPIFFVLSWWLIPLEYIIRKFFDYSDNKYFTCKNIGETK